MKLAPSVESIEFDLFHFPLATLASAGPNCLQAG